MGVNFSQLFKQSKADLGRAAAQRQFGSPATTSGSEGAPDSAVFSYMLGRGSFQDARPEVREGNLYDTPECICHLQRDAEMSQLGTSSVNFSIFACILTRTVKGGIRFLPAQIGNPKSSCSYKTHTWLDC